MSLEILRRLSFLQLKLAIPQQPWEYTFCRVMDSKQITIPTVELTLKTVPRETETLICHTVKELSENGPFLATGIFIVSDWNKKNPDLAKESMRCPSLLLDTHKRFEHFKWDTDVPNLF